MKRALIIKQEAEMDLLEYYVWYEKQKIGLGSEFFNEIEKIFDRIIIFPNIYPKKSKLFRQVVVRRFPFVIVYKVEKTEIIIFGVYHTSRNPEIKFKP